MSDIIHVMKQTTVTNISIRDINTVTYLDFHHSLQTPKNIENYIACQQSKAKYF